jgi:hypothetical protein
MRNLDQLRRKYRLLRPVLNERLRRLWAGTEALALGRGGIAEVARATGLARTTVREGAREVQALGRASGEPPGTGRVRGPGAGRPALTRLDPTLLRDLEALLVPPVGWDRLAPLWWTCKSTAQLAAELQARGHRISRRKVAQLLHDLGYRWRATRGGWPAGDSAEPAEQFAYINAQARAFLERDQPVLSVEIRRARRGRPGPPEELEERPADPEPEAAVNGAGVWMGIEPLTAGLVGELIRQWWQQLGQYLYPGAAELLILADVGGGHGQRAWQAVLQRLADEWHGPITTCRLPPCACKWDKIRQRLSCQVQATPPGECQVSYQVLIEVIGARAFGRRGAADPALSAAHSHGCPPAGAGESGQGSVQSAAFHGDWNYTIVPGSEM